jgi:hypothetical protein
VSSSEALTIFRPFGFEIAAKELVPVSLPDRELVGSSKV